MSLPLLQLAVLNPNKCYALEYLIRKHSKDKIIIFSESVVALELLAKVYVAGRVVCNSAVS